MHWCADSQFGPFWSISRYDDIVAIEAQPALFSSEAKHGGVSIIDINPAEASYFESFIMMDPPRHAEKRRTIAPAFTPSEMTRLTDSIRARTALYLDALPRGEAFNWVDRVSIPLTIDMLAILFDFPWDERENLRIWSDAITSIEMIANRPQERVGLLFQMAGRFHQLWQERLAADPAPDLLSMMIHSQSFGEMDATEFMGNMATLIVGGNDTTRNSMSGLARQSPAGRTSGTSCAPTRRLSPMPPAKSSAGKARHCICAAPRWRMWRSGATRSARATSWCCGMSRPTARRNCFQMATCSSSIGPTRGGTSRSATASTAALAHGSPSCNCRC